MAAESQWAGDTNYSLAPDRASVLGPMPMCTTFGFVNVPVVYGFGLILDTFNASTKTVLKQSLERLYVQIS